MVGILHHRHAGHGGRRLFQIPAICREAVLEDGEAGDVAARLGEAGDEAVADRIGHHQLSD